MMAKSKRKDRVAPPAGPGQWELRFGTSAAVKGWENLCAQAPGPTSEAFDHLRTNPRAKSSRQAQLKGDLATRKVQDRTLEQWQYEVTGGGRIWYVVDDDVHTLWITEAGVGHPSRTDRRAQAG